MQVSRRFRDQTSGLEGVLVPLHGKAVIGVEADGARILERFLPGIVSMPEHGLVVVSRQHNAVKLIGRIDRLWETTIAVPSRRASCTAADGADAAQLIAAGMLGNLSIEFGPRQRDGFTVTRSRGAVEVA